MFHPQPFQLLLRFHFLQHCLPIERLGLLTIVPGDFTYSSRTPFLFTVRSYFLIKDFKACPTQFIPLHTAHSCGFTLVYMEHKVVAGFISYPLTTFVVMEKHINLNTDMGTKYFFYLMRLFTMQREKWLQMFLCKTLQPRLISGCQRFGCFCSEHKNIECLLFPRYTGTKIQ